ncbi:MAG TPA: VWA domain-containing protein [Bryobacteraceae bacterium]|nr:VWA domain-containing protein [Bryobacteraceae bacterium]
MFRCLLALALVPALMSAATNVIVTVVEQKTGVPVKNLKADDFAVLDDKSPRRVEAAEFADGPMDVALLVDSSLMGEMVRPFAEDLIRQLQPKEQMAVIAFHSAADLIQDFTSSRELLRQAVGGIKYGNEPRVLDAVYAAIDSGFGSGSFRRVIILVTTGFEGNSRVGERQVIRLARRNQVSIFPVYAVGVERSMLEALARQTGGASFNLRDMRKSAGNQPGARIFEVLRSHYTLSVTGNLGLSDKLKVEVKRPGKFFVSALALD